MKDHSDNKIATLSDWTDRLQNTLLSIHLSSLSIDERHFAEKKANLSLLKTMASN